MYKRTTILCFLFAARLSTILAAEPVAGDSAGKLAEFSMPANGRSGVFLPVTLHGRTYDFLLDTGASVNVYHESLRSALGEPIGRKLIDTATLPSAVEAFHAPPARVGELRLDSNTPVTCLDLEPHWPGVGREIHGIVGMDFLRRYLVELDFDESKVRLFAADSGRTLASSHTAPLHFSHLGLPCLYVDVSESPNHLFMIDTGMVCTGTIGFETVVRLPKDSTMKWAGVQAIVGASGEPQPSVLLRAPRLGVGPYVHQELVLQIAPRSTLGLGYLSRFRVLFDFPQGRLQLQKGSRYEDYDHSDRDGINFSRNDQQQTYVCEIMPRSAADQAGVRPFDKILRINGQDANSLRLAEIDRILTADGRNVTLLVGRGNDEIEIVLDRTSRR